MKKANVPAAQRGRKREYRTKHNNDGRTAAIQIAVSQSVGETLRYLERKRNITPEQVLILGMHCLGV